jgi:NAD(P)-dependent dehydrogenase (short-subunit alcohol dehydrogenase family)
MSFADKVAIITGGSAGIGLAAAEKLVLLGAKVALVARTRSTLDAEVARLGVDAAAGFALDVSDFDALARLPERVLQRFGRIDYVIHNAGLNTRGPVSRVGAKALTSIIDVNLTAPIVLSRACLEHLQPGSSMVYVASLAGMVPVPGEASYSASKAGLRAFVRALADETRSRKIHCGLVSPGPVDTNFFGEHLSEVPDLVFSQPLSSASEVAECILRCIREERGELVIPGPSGLLCTAAYVFPGLAKHLRPMLERRGRRAKKAYLNQRRSSRGP